MTTVYPETGADWNPWADFDAFGDLLAADRDPIGPMFTVNVRGVPMVPAYLVAAGLDAVADMIQENRRRTVDLTVAVGTRLVDIEADAMGLALDLFRGILAETPEDGAPHPGRWKRLRAVLRRRRGHP